MINTVKNSNILITGGAGYIGSHVAKQLLEKTKSSITIIDNLSTGSQRNLDTLFEISGGRLTFVKADLKDFEFVNEIVKKYRFDTVMHFAASIVVPESVENPLKYYMNNTVNTTNLIKSSLENGVGKFIFSSTAAVYGEPKNLPDSGIDEEYPAAPINPYGMSKSMSERVLIDTAKANSNFKYVIFRYFNVAGADVNGATTPSYLASPRIGQSFPDATHLIKIASECAAGKRSKIYIFGDDYPTPDGTGIRDYIHVDDLAYAHIKAIEYLDSNESDIFNVGYGKGYSVKDVISTMKMVTNKDFIVEIAPRRAGDPAKLIANNAKIKKKMNWHPNYDDLGFICKTAYEWEKKLL